MHPSVNYSYYYQRYILGDTEQDGSTIWSGVRASKGKGKCRESLWPQCLDKLSPSSLRYADRDAFNYRSAFYQRCYSINDVKHCLNKFSLPVILSFKLFESIDKAEKYGVIPLPNKNEKQIDVHAVCVVGYNDNLQLSDDNGNINTGYFTFINSWGKEWGDNGHGYLPYSYFNNITEIALETKYHKKIDYKNFKIKHNNENLILLRGSSQGYTITHNNIMFTDLYKENRELIGWVITSRNDQDTIELIDFFVWPDYRNNGYGQILLQETISYLKDHNYKYIYGWFSKDDNLQDGWLIVTKFFRKNGFDCIQNKDIFSWSTGRIDFDMY